MGLGSLHPGREGKARQWREGWGGRLGNGWERKGGEGEEISIHGFKLVSPPMAGARSNSVRMPFLPPPMTHGYQRELDPGSLGADTPRKPPNHGCSLKVRNEVGKK